VLGNRSTGEQGADRKQRRDDDSRDFHLDVPPIPYRRRRHAASAAESGITVKLLTTLHYRRQPDITKSVMVSLD
jgi:hypothetical protein